MLSEPGQQTQQTPMAELTAFIDANQYTNKGDNNSLRVTLERRPQVNTLTAEPDYGVEQVYSVLITHCAADLTFPGASATSWEEAAEKALAKVRAWLDGWLDSQERGE